MWRAHTRLSSLFLLEYLGARVKGGSEMAKLIVCAHEDSIKECQFKIIKPQKQA